MNARARAALVVAAVALMGAVSSSGGIADGKAGLAALQAGKYDEAIRLFTRALQPGRLSAEDTEFAYLNRGQAYEAKGDLNHAIADFKKAVKLKPDDADAQNALNEVNSKLADASAPPPPAEPPPPPPPADPWGFYDDMVGRCYWRQALGHDPHETWVKYAWIAQGQSLSAKVRDKTGQTEVGEYTRDAHTGSIIYSAMVQDLQVYGTLAVAADSILQYTYLNGLPGRDILKRDPAGGFVVTHQAFLNGSWRDTTTVHLVEASSDDLIAQGMLKRKQKC
jgi:tetratricopeptide (TPR) repeat protein